MLVSHLAVKPKVLGIVMPCRSLPFLLLLYATLFCFPAAFAQTNVAMPDAGGLSASDTARANDTSHCQSLATGDSRMAPLSDVCKFALTYLHELPDFVCEQTTRGSDTVFKAQVTFEHGHEHYSDITINGKPFRKNSSALVSRMKVFSSGELGTNLVDLFEAPIVAQFQFRKESKLRDVRALVYSFDIPADKNTFWPVRDGRGTTLRPEYTGELWVEKSNHRLLRLESRPVHLPEDFGIANAQKTIEYDEVRIVDAGMFLLPSKSETTVCTWNGNLTTCTTNVLTFQGCQKFGTKTRILPESPKP